MDGSTWRTLRFWWNPWLARGRMEVAGPPPPKPHPGRCPQQRLGFSFLGPAVSIFNFNELVHCVSAIERRHARQRITKELAADCPNWDCQLNRSTQHRR